MSSQDVAVGTLGRLPLRWTRDVLRDSTVVHARVGEAAPTPAQGAAADAGRARSPAPDRKGQVKYDGDILHIIEQYPGCDDAHVLAFLCERVHWLGRGTFFHKVFRPSRRTVHAAGRRLEAAGRIMTKVDAQPQELLRFYPNTPVWARQLGLALAHVPPRWNRDAL